MNIFVLDRDPEVAAQYACDKHVVKMILETAQLLCGVYEENYYCDKCGEVPYKRTHYNHPCAIWARSSLENFNWLIRHGLALSREYTKRYGKTHKSERVIMYCAWHSPGIESLGLTEFAQAMPEAYKMDDAVEAYRLYYMKEKNTFAKWAKVPTPIWWEKGVSN